MQLLVSSLEHALMIPFFILQKLIQKHNNVLSPPEISYVTTILLLWDSVRANGIFLSWGAFWPNKLIQIQDRMVETETPSNTTRQTSVSSQQLQIGNAVSQLFTIQDRRMSGYRELQNAFKEMLTSRDERSYRYKYLYPPCSLWWQESFLVKGDKAMHISRIGYDLGWVHIETPTQAKQRSRCLFNPVWEMLLDTKFDILGAFGQK